MVIGALHTCMHTCTCACACKCTRTCVHVHVHVMCVDMSTRVDVIGAWKTVAWISEREPVRRKRADLWVRVKARAEEGRGERCEVRGGGERLG